MKLIKEVGWFFLVVIILLLLVIEAVQNVEWYERGEFWKIFVFGG